MPRLSLALSTEPAGLSRTARMLIAIAACLATTLLATPLRNYLDLANIVMLFLLTVLVLAVTLGRDCAVLASALSVILFDVFFVPPRFSLAVSNIQYLITFAVMLTTALVTTHLTAGLKRRAAEAQRREQTTQALYTLARELAGTLNFKQLCDTVQVFIERQLAAKSFIQISADHGAQFANAAPTPFVIENHLLQAALNSGTPIYSPLLTDNASVYLPLQTAMRIRGVLAIEFSDNSPQRTPACRALLDAIASLTAVAVERLHYVEVAQSTQLNMISERLRSSILSALSHDLRTPLTVLVGLADSLTLLQPPLPAAALDTAQAIHEQATHMANLVGNLLDMARLNAGNIALRREWQPLDEVIGASIKLLGSALSEHPVSVKLPADLPLLEFDAVLMERVFCNLLENAAKYSPAGTPIDISAALTADHVTVYVRDRGPGFPMEQQAELFAMFGRGHSESNKLGVGLGLAICRAIVEAHAGEIGLQEQRDGGCIFFSLPLGEPPVLEEEPV